MSLEAAVVRPLNTQGYTRVAAKLLILDGSDGSDDSKRKCGVIHRHMCLGILFQPRDGLGRSKGGFCHLKILFYDEWR